MSVAFRRVRGAGIGWHGRLVRPCWGTTELNQNRAHNVDDELIGIAETTGPALGTALHGAEKGSSLIRAFAPNVRYAPLKAGAGEAEGLRFLLGATNGRSFVV